MHSVNVLFHKEFAHIKYVRADTAWLGKMANSLNWLTNDINNEFNTLTNQDNTDVRLKICKLNVDRSHSKLDIKLL